MSRHLLRAAAASAMALFAGLLTTPPLRPTSGPFFDVGSSHLPSVRVSHGASLLGVTARDNDMRPGTYYHFWIDTNSANPGPEYKAEVYPNSDGLIFRESGATSPAPASRSTAGASGPSPMSTATTMRRSSFPRSCIGTPSSVRVAVVGYYDENNDNHIDVVDWGTGRGDVLLVGQPLTSNQRQNPCSASPGAHRCPAISSALPSPA